MSKKNLGIFFFSTYTSIKKYSIIFNITTVLISANSTFY